MRLCQCKVVFAVLAAGCACLTLPRLWALDPQDFGVLVSAQVQSSPPAIGLFWAGNPFVNGYTVSRKSLTDQGWSRLTSLPGNATGFTDSGVVLGATYEYEIAATDSDGLNAYGYIYGGIEVPVAGPRGRVVLVVDAAYSSNLAAELAQFSSDLVGDGWTVLRHDVSRSAAPADIRGIIQSDYYADTANTKAVCLVGHVPVPYSGDIDPDEHSNHVGAWPADLFYGNMDGAWSDDSVYDTSAEDPRNHNVPGDGKFDQSDIPGTVTLQVGRIDFVDLPAFSSHTDVDLLRQYFNKNHAFRFKLFSPDRRGLIRDNFGDIDGDAPATDAWRSFTAFFGADGITEIGAGDFFPLLDSQSFLWAYGGGGGEYYQADGVGSTTDFANQSPQAVFYMLDGSYFGDWDTSDNFLRAALATSGWGLAAAWTGLPHWYLHHMALGETIGLSTLVAQNNRDLYKNQINIAANKVHIALMGDPTLHMHIVQPPGNVSASSAASDTVEIQWSPSGDATQGYYVYRSDSSTGPFARITRRFITGTAYTDTGVPPGAKTYMVRAVKLETTGSGTYYNASQGAFGTLDTGGGQPLPVVTIDAPNPNASEAGPTAGAFTVSRTAPLSYALQVNFTVGGTASNGVDYAPISNSVVIPKTIDSAWITIQPIPDTLVEGNETVTLTLLPDAGYLVGSSASATVVIQDQVIDQPPSLSPIPDQTVTMNGPGSSIALTVSDPDTAPSALVVGASSSNETVLPSGNIVLQGNDQARSLRLTPVPGAVGSSTVTVTVSDGTLSASRSFQFTVVEPGNIQTITWHGTGGPTIQFKGTLGQSYALQWSKDLVNWTTLASGVISSEGSNSFTDVETSPGVCRFYRMRWP